MLTEKILKRANELKEKMHDLDMCINSIDYGDSIRVLGRPLHRGTKLVLWAYGRSTEHVYCSVGERTKEKIIQALKEEREDLKKEFERLQ